MTTGFLGGGEAMQMQSRLTNPQEVICLAKPNKDCLVAIEVELRLIADNLGQ